MSLHFRPWRLRDRLALLVLSSVALIGSLLAVASYAQTVPGSLNVSWKLPVETECVAGSNPCVRLPLTGDQALTGVELFVDIAPIPDNYAGAPVATLGAAETRASYSRVVPNGSTLYVRLKAKTASSKSLFSGQASKLIKVDAPPGAPTEVTVSFEVGVGG